MKTQIITLESHDDLISVRDKLSWAKTPRILLVWPKYAKVTLRILDLKVLQRHADSLGAQLGLVTRRAKVRRDAESLGIPVFASTTTAQRELWPDPVPRSTRTPKPPRRDLREIRDAVYQKEPAWRTSLLGRVLTFTVGVMAFVTVAGLFVPRAALTLYPETQVQSIVIPVAASEATASISLAGGVPALTLSVTEQAEQSLAIVSEISVPKSKAKGVVQFTNLSQNELSIPAGTVVATAAEVPVKFTTLEDATLAAGIDEVVEIPIEAQQAGTDGNVPNDAVIVVEGPLGLTVSVTNPEPVTGGVISQVTGANDDDRARLREVMLENLRRMAETELRSKIGPADVLLVDTLEIKQVLSEAFDPPAGQPGKTLVLNMQVEFSARYVSDDAMRELSLATLNAAGQDGFVSTSAPDYKVITEPSTDNSGISHFELMVTRTLLREVDEMRVFSIVRGGKPDLMKAELASALSLRRSPDILLTPSWWPWMPLIPFNISVEMK